MILARVIPIPDKSSSFMTFSCCMHLTFLLLWSLGSGSTPKFHILLISQSWAGFCREQSLNDRANFQFRQLSSAQLKSFQGRLNLCTISNQSCLSVLARFVHQSVAHAFRIAGEIVMWLHPWLHEQFCGAAADRSRTLPACAEPIWFFEPTTLCRIGLLNFLLVLRCVLVNLIFTECGQYTNHRLTGPSVAMVAGKSVQTAAAQHRTIFEVPRSLVLGGFTCVLEAGLASHCHNTKREHTARQLGWEAGEPEGCPINSLQQIANSFPFDSWASPKLRARVV